MMHTEKDKLTLEDKKELSIQIKELEETIKAQREDGVPEWIITNKELRRLRRIRDAK